MNNTVNCILLLFEACTSCMSATLLCNPHSGQVHDRPLHGPAPCSHLQLLRVHGSRWHGLDADSERRARRQLLAEV